MDKCYLLNDICVCCGAPVPEGWQVCRYCEKETDSSRPRHLSLLDVMSIQMGCTYLSDLHFLNSDQRALLAGKLNRLTPKDADLHDWNDALEYLTGDSRPRATAEQAKAALIAGLSAP